MKLFFLLAMISFNTFSYDTFLRCEAIQGRSYGIPLVVDSQLDLAIAKLRSGLLEIYGGSGYVNTTYEENGLDSEYVYRGQFDTIAEIENAGAAGTKYTPERFAQFRNIDATTTENSTEDGMWGYLVVERKADNRGRREAHYVFQAGDHIGGTIDYECVE